MLSRKHYRMIAKCIKDNSDNAVSDYVGEDMINKSSLIDDISNELKRDNINFNYTTFRDACE